MMVAGVYQHFASAFKGPPLTVELCCTFVLEAEVMPLTAHTHRAPQQLL